LRSQEGVIVLFDEIDQFLLDRNSTLYNDQDDVFKFMTPGMLTKLQNLREAEGVIFIIATNYYERIDSAIKRRGRIDDHFLLSIPDQKQRLILLARFVSDTLVDRFESNPEAYREAAASEKQKAFLTKIEEAASKDEKTRQAGREALRLAVHHS